MGDAANERAGRGAPRFYFWRRNGEAEYCWRAPGCHPDDAIDITDLADDEFEQFVKDHQ